MQDGPKLLEHVSGPMGEAYHYTYSQDALDSLAKQGTPLSPTWWLVHLPNEATTESEEDYAFSGVFKLGWLNCDAPMWSQFRPDLSYFNCAYLLDVSEAFGGDDEAAVDPLNPATVHDYGEPLMQVQGNDRAAADQHMRNWVDALLSGALHPHRGVEAAADDAEAIAFYDSLRESAEADPTAHLRNRVPVADSNMVGLFG